MTKSFPLQILEHFARRLGVNFEPSDMQGPISAPLQSIPGQPDELLPFLNEYGAHLNLIFVQNAIQPEHLEELINNAILPILVFPGPMSKGPWMLCEVEGRRVRVISFTEDGTVEESRELSVLLPELRASIPPGESLPIIAALHVEPTFSDNRPTEEEITPVKRLMRLMSVERRDISLIFVYAGAVGLLSLTLPLGVSRIVGMVSGGLLLQAVVVLIGFVVFGTLASGVLQIFQIRVVESIQQRVFARAAFEFAFRIPRIKLESIQNYYAPELMNRFFDIVTIQKGFAKVLTEFSTSLLNIFFGMVLLTFYHPFFVAFDLVLIFVLAGIFRFTGPRGLRTSLEESREKYRVAHWLEEVARTMSSFKLAGFTNLAMERMDEGVARYLKKRRAHFRVLLSQYGAMVGFKTLVTGSLLVLGSLLVIDRQITLGQFVASEIVIITIMTGVEKILLALNQVYDLLTASEKMGTVTDLPLERSHGVLLGGGLPAGMQLNLQEVTYQYEGRERPTLDRLSLDVPAGARIALIGLPGSGKTTFLRLLTGLLHHFKGAIQVDGISLRDINSASLRDQAGQAMVTDQLFEGTIAENISLGKYRTTMTDINWAIEHAGLTDFVRNQPYGLQTGVVGDGQQLPASIVRRIVLARALAERPRLLLLDEGFLSPEPYDNNPLLQLLLDKEVPWTAIVATTHPDYLERCDKILILEDGQRSFYGTLSELRHDERLCELIRAHTGSSAVT